MFIGDPIDLFGSNKVLDGGAGVGTPCIDESTRVSGSTQTIVSVSADQLALLVQGQHGSDLVWPDGNETFLTATFSNVAVFSVHSHRNPRYGAPISSDQCIDHARIEAQMQLQTSDGRLHETLPLVSFRAFDNEQAETAFSIAASALKGSYSPPGLGKHCYLGSDYRMLVALDGTHGSMVDRQLTAGCDNADAGVVATLTIAGGHWGTRWRF